MKHVRLWVTAVVLYVGLVVFVFNSVGDRPAVTSTLKDFIFWPLTILIVVAFSCLLLGSLMSIIPFRKRTYWEKYQVMVPVMASVSVFIIFLFFAYSAYSDKVQDIEYSDILYPNIKAAENLDCSKVHDGEFETALLKIERNDTAKYFPRKLELKRIKK